MIIMLDTNIILDNLIKERLYSFPDSSKALRLILSDDQNTCYISASAITDIYYILRKSFRSPEAALSSIKEICKFACIADVRESDIRMALESCLPNFEDSVVDSVAYRLKCNLILTRNSCDYTESSVPAITPTDFISSSTDYRMS